MSEEAEAVDAETVEEAGAQTETAPEQPKERVFTQAEVDAMLAREAAKAKRRAKRELESKMNQPEPKQESTSSAEDNNKVAEAAARVEAMAAELEAKMLEADYRSAVAGMDIPETEAKFLRWAYENDREAFDAKKKALAAPDSPPERKGPGPNLPGAPAGSPPGTISESPMDWTGDQIAMMRKNGTFLDNLQRYRDSLPGGGGGLFRAKTPGKK